MTESIHSKKSHSITLRGSAANTFMAEMMVDLHGEKARENCEGPALEAINHALARRAQPGLTIVPSHKDSPQLRENIREALK